MDTLVNTKIHDERIFILAPRIDMERALTIAGSKATSLFGVERTIYRLKPEDIKVTRNKLYYEPFWHIRCDVHYNYDRICSHNITTIAPEVDSLTINEHNYAVIESDPRVVTISGKEHCTTTDKANIIIDAEHGKMKDFEKYLDYQKEQVDEDYIFPNEDSIFLPPKMNSNALVHYVFSSLSGPIEPDSNLKGEANINLLDLYFRPVYTIEYTWEKRKKTKVTAVDGITGEKIKEDVTFHEKVKNIVASDLFFDVSAETANLIIPGSGIAFIFIKEYNKKK